jgi:pimeloyl-ACP methyl ester carboxylesterase
VLIERRFAHCVTGTGSGLRLHWREAGAAGAPPLVLLHASPRSSAMFEPWMAMLAPHFRVFAPDTPGYGQSDALGAPPASVADYLPVLRAWLREAVGDTPVHLYGSATGAQLGIAFTNAHPAAVRHLFIDNAAHFDEAEREAITARYFIDLAPRAGGEHLHDAWRMAEQMLQFFPWFAADEAHRVGPPNPAPAAVHAAMMDMLGTGAHWAAAYRAAFAHERAEHVQRLVVPTLIFRWEASILGRHIDRLLAHPLPAHVRAQSTPAALPARYAVMTEALRGTLSSTSTSA